MRGLLLIPCVALALAGSAQATLRRGVLQGEVRRGPITPVCSVTQPCDEPAKDTVLLFSRDDHVLGRVATDDEGRYRLRLPTGIYIVRRPAATTIDYRLTPKRVRVRAGRVTTVDFFIDTGIR